MNCSECNHDKLCESALEKVVNLLNLSNALGQVGLKEASETVYVNAKGIQAHLVAIHSARTISYNISIKES